MYIIYVYMENFGIFIHIYVCIYICKIYKYKCINVYT